MWEYSWQNLIMLMASIPSYESDTKKTDFKEIESIEELEGLI
jgi:hypothetical protein